LFYLTPFLHLEYFLWLRFHSGNYIGFSLKGDTAISPCYVELSPNTWYYFELNFTVGSNAAYEFRVNGAATNITGNGDTQSGSANYYDTLVIFPSTSTHDKFYDDLYLCDATGASHNTFLGDCKIVSLKPDGDDSCNFATLSTGNDHYALVDEDPCDEDTTYVEDNTSGNIDLLTYESLTGVSTIYGINVITIGKRTGTTAHKIKAVVKSGNTTNTGSNYALITAYSSDSHILTTDPDTSSSWTPSSINSAKFGFEVV